MNRSLFIIVYAISYGLANYWSIIIWRGWFNFKFLNWKFRFLTNKPREKRLKSRIIRSPIQLNTFLYCWHVFAEIIRFWSFFKKGLKIKKRKRSIFILLGKRAQWSKPCNIKLKLVFIVICFTLYDSQFKIVTQKLWTGNSF